MKDNKLIAQFMGYSSTDGHNSWKNKDGKYLMIQHSKYHYHWNWLMPVVDKIHKELYVIIVKFNLDGVSVKVKQNYDESEILASGFTSDLDPMKAYYQAVVEFIKWYNNTK